MTTRRSAPPALDVHTQHTAPAVKQPNQASPLVLIEDNEDTRTRWRDGVTDLAG